MHERTGRPLGSEQFVAGIEELTGCVLREQRLGPKRLWRELSMVSPECEIVPADRELARMAAELKAEHPVAYGDCFAAALAVIRSCSILTGDKEFQRFGAKVEVDWL